MKWNLFSRILFAFGICLLLQNCSRKSEESSESHHFSEPYKPSEPDQSTIPEPEQNMPNSAPSAPEQNYSDNTETGTVQIFDIRFVVEVTQYKAALWLKNGEGLMRVRYYKEGVGPVMVQQKMRVENTDRGIRLTGYSPVNPETGETANYIPDNFYISRNENGEWSVTNIDDQGVTAEAFISVIEGIDEQNRFLSNFNWEIN
ncbi:hypothetical protein [Spirosoma aerolatum]|uniref:hypothetical protein n=1 Tax=Spirosoma aerolatum TaxID=1211326 RepID=UPI0012D2F8CA|nr:hypothetical protein [Spirosoma aerolatum]